MVRRADRVVDMEAALAYPAEFHDDPDDQGWMTASAGAQTLYVRMSDFPDDDLWSLWLGDGRWMDFTVPPARWILPMPSVRQSTGRPRLPKNEFHE